MTCQKNEGTTDGRVINVVFIEYIFYIGLCIRKIISIYKSYLRR